MQNTFINAVNQKSYEDSLSIYKEMYERNFLWENLTVQLRQLAAFLDTSNISVTKLFESLVNFGINKSHDKKNDIARSNQTRKTTSCPTCNQGDK